MMRAFLPCCLVLLLLPPAACAQGPPAAGEAPHQFLFVVERSSAMKRSETVTLSTVYQLLATGAYGAMRRGDIFGIWTFDREVYDKKFPPQVWVPEVSGALAGSAAQFLKGEKYSWAAKLDPAVARFVQTMKAAPAMTVFLITDGSEVLFGTPFDLEISTILVQHASEMAKEKRPFVVTLAARDGKITGWSVDAGGGRIAVPIAAKPDNQAKPPEPADVMPDVKTAVAATPSKPPTTVPPKPVPVPESPKPAPTEPAKVVEPVKPAAPKVTVQPAKPATVVTPPASPPHQPSPASKPAEVVVTTPKPATVQPPPSSPPVVSQPATQPAPQPIPLPAPLPKKMVPAVVVEPVPAPVPPMVPVEIPRPTTGQPQTTAATPVRETPPVVAKTAPAAAPERVDAPAKPAVKSPPPAQTAVVAPGEAAVSGWNFLFLGGTLLMVVAIMVMVLLRRARAVPQASLISQSLDRERK